MQNNYTLFMLATYLLSCANTLWVSPEMLKALERSDIALAQDVIAVQKFNVQQKEVLLQHAHNVIQIRRNQAETAHNWGSILRFLASLLAIACVGFYIFKNFRKKIRDNKLIMGLKLLLSGGILYIALRELYKLVTSYSTAKSNLDNALALRDLIKYMPVNNHA